MVAKVIPMSNSPFPSCCLSQFKASPGTQPLKWNELRILMQIKLIFLNEFISNSHSIPRVGSIPTLVRVFLCPCVGPFPSVGLTLTWFIWGQEPMSKSLPPPYKPYESTFARIFLLFLLFLSSLDNDFILIGHFKQCVQCRTTRGALKIERYRQRLTQGYSAYGGSYSWAPDGVETYHFTLHSNQLSHFPYNS